MAKKTAGKRKPTEPWENPQEELSSVMRPPRKPMKLLPHVKLLPHD